MISDVIAVDLGAIQDDHEEFITCGVIYPAVVTRNGYAVGKVGRVYQI